MKQRHEIIIVGSGPGGSISAVNLLKAGFDVLVIERGDFFRMGELQEYSYKEMKKKYNNGGLTATLGISRINYVEGSCLGGGSEINSGLYHRLPQKKFLEWKDKFGLEYDNKTLLNIYNEIEKRLNISFSPKEEIPLASLKLLEGSQKMGLNCIEVPRWVKVSKKGTVKQSMTETYLNEYINLGGKYILNSSVEKIKKYNNIFELEISSASKKFKLECTKIFLCSGAIHSPYLLRKSGIINHIGSTLKLHPSFKFIAEFDQIVNKKNMGVPVHQVKGHKNYSMGCSISSRAYLGIGLNDTANYKKIKNWQNMASYYVMISPEGYGKVRAYPWIKSPLVFYKLLNKDYECLIKGAKDLGNILLESGARALYPSCNKSIKFIDKNDLERLTKVKRKNLNLMSIHLFSSLRMGNTAQKYATNPYGKLWEEDNIFINDASILCDSPGVNPQGTILAFAKYNIDNFIENNSKNEI